MKHRLLTLGCLALFLMAGCSNLEEVNSRLSSLENRVTALEKQIAVLNQNVEATSRLMQAGTIQSATEKDGVWTIILSDNREIKITEGSQGQAPVPVMTIDADGYWMISFGGEATYILYNGEKIKAFGQDGITPRFSVNADGNWTVSYDGGQTFQDVLDPEGNPVSALPGGVEPSDPYFNSVDVVDGWFVVVLKDERTLRIPIVNGFVCSISGADGLQEFEAGQTRTFEATVTGAVQVIITAPAGWEASLDDAVLSVTAPATTKAVIADTRSDVSILAISAAGAAAVAKVRVAIAGSGDEPVIPEPQVTDYYSAYQSGEDIVIAGVSYNKATYGDGILLVADVPEKDIKADVDKKSGVFFLEASAEDGSFALPGKPAISGDVIIVGRYAGKKPVIKQSQRINFLKGMFVLKNVVFDMTDGEEFAFSNNAGSATETFTRWHMEDCNFLGEHHSLLYGGKVDTGFQSVIARNCTFEITSTSSLQMYNFSNTTSLHLYKELEFTNNIVYAASPVAIQVFQYNQNIAQDNSAAWEATIKADHNLFYNCPSGNSYFKFYKVASMSMTHNIFWADSECATVTYGFILYGDGQDPAVVDASNNIAYGLASGKNWNLAHSSSKVIPEPNVLSKVHEDPFEEFVPGVSFTLKEPYRDYGPQK